MQRYVLHLSLLLTHAHIHIHTHIHIHIHTHIHTHTYTYKHTCRYIIFLLYIYDGCTQIRAEVFHFITLIASTQYRINSSFRHFGNTVHILRLDNGYYNIHKTDIRRYIHPNTSVFVSRFNVWFVEGSVSYP